MSLNKKATSDNRKMSIRPLNKPKGWDFFNLPKVIKTASITKDENLGGFDIEAAVDKYPDHLFVKIFAIKENEVNDNGDLFSASELEKSASTFVGVPIFTNHQNDDIEKAKGECIHSWYDKDDGGIYIIARVDKTAYPKLARGIEEGYITGTSMGTSVDYSICSICHNKAVTADDYCTHVRNSKNRKKSGVYACKYHESEDKPEDNCPICGCEAGKKKDNTLKDAEVFEYNYGLKFIENSFVVNPACHSCGVDCILHVPELQKKVANLKESINKLEKHADKESLVKNTEFKEAKKVAGSLELDMLKEALNRIEKVTKSMMTQKNYVDLEYVSDLVKAMADVQGTIDELQEMGYSQVPSPPDVVESGESGADGIQTQGTDPASMAFPPVAQQTVAPFDASNPNADSNKSELGGGLGSITKPKTSSVTDKKKEFISISHNVTNKLANLRNLTVKLSNRYGSNRMADTFIDVWENKNDTDSHHVIIDDEYVTKARGSEVLSATKISTLDENIQKELSENPQKFAEKMLENTIKESSTSMSDKNEKTAALGPNDTDESSQQEHITEKQLRSNEPELHPRWDDTYEQITQSDEQLGRGDDRSNDTTSNSPQKRLGTYETITEDQLESIASGYIVRWEDAPDIITEKQWDDMSRLVSSKLPDDWTETITQDQLRNLLESHSTAGTYETITEDQLANRLGGIKRWASGNYARHLAKVASEVISDVVANFSKTPDEIRDTVAEINDDSAKKSKVAFMTVVNSLPQKEKSRKDFIDKAVYFRNKTASSNNNASIVDALVVTAASRAGLGVKAEDIYEAMGHVFRKKTALAHIDKLVEKKLAKTELNGKVIDKFAALDNAFDSMDGVLIKATVDEIGVDYKDKPAFVEACKKYAKKMHEAEGLGESLTILEIKLDPETGVLTIEAGEGDEVEETDDYELMGEMEGDVADVAEQDGLGDELGDEENKMYMDKGNEDMCMEKGKEMATPAYSSEQNNSKESKNKDKNNKEARAAKREEMKKKAQLAGGEMGGQGGASQMPGAGASLPQSPALDAAPMESFNAPPMEEGMDDSGDLQPKPPGSACPVCTSADVDIIAGKGKCNNCGSEMTYKVSIDVNKWADLLGDQDDGENEAEEGFEGEGFDLPDEGEGMPVAASSEKLEKVASQGVPFAIMAKLKPESIKKASDEGLQLGTVSPITGSVNTHKVSSNQFVCLDTGTPYKVELAVPTNGGLAYAQWSWNVKKAEVCKSCRRQKSAFVNALSRNGISQEQFDGMNLEDKAKTILKLKEAGSLDGMIKVASKTGSIVNDYKLAYGVYGDRFPIESCREKLARRYGKNALALSGPCEGEPIHECVCSQLKSAGFYTDKLAVKVAEAWADKDGTEECVEDQVRSGLDIRSAAVVCSALKTALAANEDLLADELGNDYDMDGDVDDLDMDMGVEPEVDDLDPFDGESEGIVTLELSEDLAKELDAALDVELGSDPTDDVNVEEGESVGDPEVAGDTLGDPDVSPELPGDEGPTDEVADLEPMEHGMEEAKGMEHGMDKGNKGMYMDKGDKDMYMDKGDSCGCEEGVLEEHPEKDQEDLKIEVGRLASDENKEINEAEKLLNDTSHMRSSFNQTGKVSLDLDSVASAIGLNKEADEKEVEMERVQDSNDIGSYSEGDPLGNSHPSSMHNEEESVPTADRPSVPRNDARMGHEEDDVSSEMVLPEIPSDKGTMGHEDEVGLEGGDARISGGDEGAGYTGGVEASSDDNMQKEAALESELARMRGVVGNSNDRTDSLVERILQAGKLEEPKPVADDEDVKPHSTGKGIGHEEDFSADEPTTTEGSGNESMMGHENESLGDTPKSPSDHPEVPEDNQLMGHEEDEEIGPEKQLKDKGTVIARGDEESSKPKQSSGDAFRVAGRMLAEGMIKASELEGKIQELSKYESSHIKELEKTMFSKKAETAKGLTTASEGIEQALVIPESASHKNSRDDLTGQLRSLFTLGQQNEHAQNLPDFDTKRLFRK